MKEKGHSTRPKYKWNDLFEQCKKDLRSTWDGAKSRFCVKAADSGLKHPEYFKKYGELVEGGRFKKGMK